MKRLRYTFGAFGRSKALLMVADKGATGSKGTKPATAAPTPDEQEAQDRRQAEAAARTLRDQAEQRAKLQADAGGNTPAIEATPTAEELYQAARSGKSESPAGVTRGPTPATTEAARPGETYSGPATGRLATGTVIPEHRMASVIPSTPTINAPGLGADSGIKKTADNPDARGGGGAPDPADNIRTPEMPNPNADASPAHAERRLDTPEIKAARDIVTAKIRGGEVPSRKELEASGIPKEEIGNALEQAKKDAEAAKISAAATAGQTGTAGALPGTVAADPLPAAVVQNPKVGEQVQPTGDGTGTSETQKSDAPK